MELLDGKATSAAIKKEIAAEVEKIVAAGGKRPHLAAILVGHDGGSETYVANKVKSCGECGFKSTLIRFESDVTEEELLAKVDELNQSRAREAVLANQIFTTQALGNAVTTIINALKPAATAAAG